MKEIELTERTQSAHMDYAPVEISENISIEASRDIHDGKYVVEGYLKRNNKELGRFLVNENQNRFFVNVNNLDEVSRNTMREIIESIAVIVLNLVPEETVDSEENVEA